MHLFSITQTFIDSNILGFVPAREFKINNRGDRQLNNLIIITVERV